jgi:signal peptidase I
MILKGKKLKRILKNILEWIALIIIIAMTVRTFLLASFVVPTPSMSPAIEPGDYVLVNKLIPGSRISTAWRFMSGKDLTMKRLKGYRKVKRNDILAFNFPYSNPDKLGLDFNIFYAKRCVALPGDSFYIENGIYKVKNVSDTLGNYTNQKKMSMMSPDDFAPHIYNCSYNTDYGWNMKNFGPLYIPRKNDTIAIDSINIKLYVKLIEYETQHTVKLIERHVYIDDDLLSEYVFQQNYYFLAGDHVFDSQYSRYWGLLPEEQIIGKVFFIWKSKDIETGKRNWKRYFKKVK